MAVYSRAVLDPEIGGARRDRFVRPLTITASFAGGRLESEAASRVAGRSVCHVRRVDGLMEHLHKRVRNVGWRIRRIVEVRRRAGLKLPRNVRDVAVGVAVFIA